MLKFQHRLQLLLPADPVDLVPKLLLKVFIQAVAQGKQWEIDLREPTNQLHFNMSCLAHKKVTCHVVFVEVLAHLLCKFLRFQHVSLLLDPPIGSNGYKELLNNALFFLLLVHGKRFSLFRLLILVF